MHFRSRYLPFFLPSPLHAMLSMKSFSSPLSARDNRWVGRSVLIGALLTLGSISIALKATAPPAEQMQTYAVAFLDTLDEEQRAKATMPYDNDQRVAWHFIPKDGRKGVRLDHMNDAQRTAALRLVRSALSEAGYSKTQQIMLLEEILNEAEGEGGRWDRNPLRYYVTIFGSPTELNGESDPAKWGLSFEGHHLSLNFVCQGDDVVDSTPQFLGSNPATVMNATSTTLGKGTSVLRLEEELAFKLVNALTDQQQKEAIIAKKAPRDIRFAGDAQPKLGPAEGIAYERLGPNQQAILKELIGVYVDVAADEVSEERRAMIEKDGWENIYFAWAGAKEPGIGHYYRIQGDRFLIELANTQSDPFGNPANHVHCVLRDLTGDFGMPIE